MTKSDVIDTLAAALRKMRDRMVEVDVDGTETADVVAAADAALALVNGEG